MSWKPIKRGLFVTIEGREREECREEEREEDREKCTDFMFKECKKYDVGDCDDYWSTCWDKFRVKVFNKIQYEGDTYHSAEYVYDISEMKHLLIIAGSLWSIAIILIINLVLNP
jgi:hypothetical protein